MKTHARWLASATALLSVCAVGCGQMLGYDDVRFGEGQSENLGTSYPTPATSVTTAGGSDGGALGVPPLPAIGDGGALPRELPPNDGGSESGALDRCSGVTCGAGARCEAATGKCVCSPGFVSSGSGTCESAPPGDPASHTEAQVCASWNQGHALTDPSPWTPGATECDPGTLSQKGIDDTLTRLAMFRYLVGLAPVVEAAGARATYMACGAVTAWNPPGTAANPHAPEPTAKCYSSAGAAGAGSANIGWGQRVPADAIDQFVEDLGNDTTFGHRRWVLNPPLGAVGIGYSAGGGPYGSSQCLGVFDGSGTGPSPEWLSFPPAGFVPLQAAGWTWTFHHKGGVATKMTVTRASDNATLPMMMLPLTQGFGVYGTAAFRAQGWSPAVGETYTVVVEGASPAPITYVVKPVGC